jgi:hypothetical protein
MSNTGRLGTVAPTAAAYKTLYKPGAGLVAGGIVIFICNKAAADDTIRVAIVQSASADPTPAASEFILYDHVIKAKGDPNYADQIQITGICLANVNNDQIVVYSTTGTTTAFNATGIEEAA